MSDKELFDQEHTISLGSTSGGGRLLKPGDIVGGNYRLKTLIGHGGMGFVFCAKHTIIDRDYALKVMAPEKLNEVNWRRFESEGRAIASLDHANIVKVYNMGVDAGDCPFIVMDLLAGTSLAQEIKTGRNFDLAQVLDIVGQTAEGLRYAHNKGIVHRDVKPSNIMLVDAPNGNPSVRLVDFGLAKLVKEDGGKAQSLTGTGDVFGSPYYMSPEQCMGTGVDERSDIYSLGCTLYEIVTGVPPYTGVTALETVFMHTNGPLPRFVEAFGDYQTESRMNLLLSRMMAKRKEDRYQNMAEVAHDLQRIKDSKEIGRQSTVLPSAGEMPQQFSPKKIDQTAEIEAEWPVRLPLKRGLIASVVLSSIVLVGFLCYAIGMLSAPAKLPASKQMQNKAQARAPGELPGGASLATEPGGDSSAGPLADSDLDVDQAGHNLILGHPDLPKATEQLKAAGKINATTVAGGKIIHFPAYPMGELMINTQRTDLASGDRRVETGATLGLLVDWCHYPFTLPNADIFEKIEKSLFDTLFVKGYIAPVADGSIKDIQVPVLCRLLTAASKWDHLRVLKIEALHSVDGEDSVLDCIDRLPHIQTLYVAGGELDMKQLSRHKFLQRLHRLELDSASHVDDMLEALAGSKEIEVLRLGWADISPRDLQKLRTCPNLKVLGFRSDKLTQDHIEALSKLPALEELWLPVTQLNQVELSALAKSSSRLELHLSPQALTAAQTSAWLKILPHLKFDCRK